MPTFLYVMSHVAGSVITVLELAMIIRVFMSWLPISEDSRFAAFMYMVTEPFIYPVRVLFDKFGWFQDSILDVPFFVVYLLIAIISIFV